MRIAVLGAGHWHVPMYLEYLRELEEEIELVAVHASSPEKLERAGALAPGAQLYDDYYALLDAETPDFVFAHAPHDEMTAMAAELVARGTPFHMEKPMGLDWRQLEPVARRAAEKRLFVSVPLVSRYFGVVSRLLELKAQGRLGKPVYFSFRLFAGTPQRYEEMGVAWMLDPARAGEGPLFNFGPHALDLFLALTDRSPHRLFAWATKALYGIAIPDLVGLVVEAEDDCRGLVEVSYTAAEGYERYFSLTTTTLSYAGPPDVGTLHFRDGTAEEVPGPRSDEAYRLYTRDVLRRFSHGEPPLVGIGQMLAILRLLNAAQRSLREGESTVP